MKSAWAYVIGVVLVLGVASIPCVTIGRVGNGERSGTSGLEIADLKEQLVFGLRAREQDYFFIDRVVAKVRTGELPLQMVTSTYAWARRKQPYPFPYFKRALQIRAKDAGIEI